MTNIELKFYELACTFFSKLSKKEIDWEQRKWDLVVKMCAAREGSTMGQGAASSINRILKEADTIIAVYTLDLQEQEKKNK